MSNCIIHRVILYLTAQNLNSSEIYRKIVETFNKNVTAEQKVFSISMTPRMTQLDTSTTGWSVFHTDVM